jgi:hypothetical protein
MVAMKMTAAHRRWFRIGFALFAVGALFYLLSAIGWDRVGQAFATIGWSGAALLFVLGLTENISDAGSLRAAVKTRIPLFKILCYNSAGAILNMVAAGEVGEVLKGALLKRHTTTSDAVTGTIVWNYIFKFSRPTVALLAALTGVVGGADVPPAIAWTVVAATALAFLPYFGLMLLVRRGMVGLVARLLRFLKIAGKDPEALIAQAVSLDQAIQGFWRTRRSDYLQVFGLQFMGRAVAWFTLFATCRLVGLDYSFALCSLLYAAFSVASYIVMLLPARIGVSEGSGYLVFSLFGLDGGIGLIVYVVLRVKALVTNGIPALLRT